MQVTVAHGLNIMMDGPKKFIHISYVKQTISIHFVRAKCRTNQNQTDESTLSFLLLDLEI